MALKFIPYHLIMGIMLLMTNDIFISPESSQVGKITLDIGSYLITKLHININSYRISPSLLMGTLVLKTGYFIFFRPFPVKLHLTLKPRYHHLFAQIVP
jgi:hypothetical protein